jgi:very-short-patch-repair endonuclease
MAQDLERQDFWTNAFFNQHARKAFRTFASMQMQYMQAHVMERVGACESPLEAAFMAWWLVMSSVGATSLELVPQQEVRAGNGRYRLDFVVRPVRGGMYSVFVGLEDAPKVCIELDGHHYHDKTRAQVNKRNKRDRDLASDGWVVLHASYSEFHDDAVATVTTVAENAHAVFEQVIGKRLLGA